MKKILFATAIILTTTASTCFGHGRFQWGKAEPVKPPVEVATIPFEALPLLGRYTKIIF